MNHYLCFEAPGVTVITPVTALSTRYPFSSAESSPKRNTLLTLAAAESSPKRNYSSALEYKVLEHFRFNAMGNDPSAGSPTETLLRLLLPLDSLVRAISVKASSVARLPLNLQSPH